MSLTLSLGNRNIPQSPPAAEPIDSFESAGADFEVASASFESDLARYDRISQAINSVEALTEMYYAESADMTKERARFYEFSVESIFAAAGEPIPARELALSFESAEADPKAAKEKTGGRLKALLQWLVQQLTELGSSVKKMASTVVATVTNRRGVISAKRDKAAKAAKEGGKKPKSDKVTIDYGGIFKTGGVGEMEAIVSKVKTNTAHIASEIRRGIDLVVRELESSASKSTFEAGDGPKALNSILSAIGVGSDGKKMYEILPDLGIAIKTTGKRGGDGHVSVAVEMVKPPRTKVELPRLSADSLPQAYDLATKVTAESSLGAAMTSVATEIENLRKSISDKWQPSVENFKEVDRTKYYRDMSGMLARLANMIRLSYGPLWEIQNAITSYADESLG